MGGSLLAWFAFSAEDEDCWAAVTDGFETPAFAVEENGFTHSLIGKRKGLLNVLDVNRSRHQERMYV